MPHLLFKQWMLSEMADYGYDSRRSAKTMGGTEIIPGDQLFDMVDTNKIIDELAKLPPLGPNFPNQPWNNIVEWGNAPGAIQVQCTTFGSLKFVARRRTSDLLGESVWICKKVRPVSDIDDEDKEISVAHEMHEIVKNLSQEMIDSPAREYEDFERLAWRMWAGLKKEHPSYCMFPIGLRKQHENYYKLVFEFRGAGQGHVDSNGGFLRQFDVDLIWDAKRGLIRCWGYNIDSATNKSDWSVSPSEWDEWFTPNQPAQEIIEAVVNIFMQY